MIEDGTYTVVGERFGKDGRRTLLFETVRTGKLAGKTVISYLSGSDNERDFTGCAFYSRISGRSYVWARFRNWFQFVEEIQAAVDLIAGNPDAARECYAIHSGRCARCGRKLTVPASIHRGLGPDCYEMMGY